VPGRARAEAVALEKDDLADTLAGKMPGDAGADDAAPDDDDFHRTLPRCTISLRASISCPDATRKNWSAATAMDGGN
jgi:hypothetical protein